MVKIFRTLFGVLLIALSTAMLSCSKDSPDDPTPPSPPEYEEINKEMDSYLRDFYLWNEDYKVLTPNYAQTYDAFLLSLLRDQMTTNTLDRKPNGAGGYRIYSNIQQLSPISPTQQSTRGVNHGQMKEAEISFGIVAMAIAQLDDLGTEFAFVVEAVYPGSPASEGGIKRGFVIEKVNGQTITDENYIDLYYDIVEPKSVGEVSLTDFRSKEVKKLTSKSIYLNPVLVSEVFSAGAKKIGYIVYQRFDAAYDDELLAAIMKLKTNNADEIIVDLRLNHGGNIISSNMFSTCIAGAACDQKVYQYYRYNDARMAATDETSKQTGLSYDAAKKYFYENFYYGDYFSVDLRQYALDMTRVFVLTSSGTASASEALINAFRGLDIPVMLIGAKTDGKNVGMEPIRLSDNRYNYRFSPITFQGYNAKGETVDHLGLDVDYAVDEWNNGYQDFGDMTEPLFAKAYELITGNTPVSAKADTRSDCGLRFVSGALPSSDLSHQGMILLPSEER